MVGRVKSEGEGGVRGQPLGVRYGEKGEEEVGRVKGEGRLSDYGTVYGILPGDPGLACLTDTCMCLVPFQFHPWFQTLAPVNPRAQLPQPHIPKPVRKRERRFAAWS